MEVSAAGLPHSQIIKDCGENMEKQTDRPRGFWRARSPIQRVLLLAVAVALVVAAVALSLLFHGGEAPAGNPQTPVQHPIAIDPANQNMADPRLPEEISDVELAGFADMPFAQTGALDEHLSVARVGVYTGNFVEDGSDEPVSEVLALIVTNTSENFVELAEIALPAEEGAALFRLTSLPAGQSVLVMEQSRKCYDSAEQYGAPVLQICSIPEKEFSLYPEVFSIRAADGVVNLINQTDTNYPGAIAIYYKNVENGIYLGGITYSKMLENGVPANGTAQFLSEHYTVAGSELMFIRYVH